MTASQFIAMFGSYVVTASMGTSLFPSVFMAQAGLETGWGNSLPANSNNYFGIKADSSWKGKKVLAWTTEEINGVRKPVQAWFRVYDDPIQSFRDRIEFLQKNSRYKANGVFSAKTPEEQAQALQRAKYATSTKYAASLINLINQFDLKKLDSQKLKLEGGISGFFLLGLAALVYWKRNGIKKFYKSAINKIA